jgi:hypothetical protein
MGWLPLIWALVIVGGIVYVFVRQERERARSSPLRAEIRAEIEAWRALEGTGAAWVPRSS